MTTLNGWRFGARAPVLIWLAVLLVLPTQSSANVTGIVRGVQENPIAGALVTFTSEANPADTFSGYTNAGGRYDIAFSALSVGDVQPVPFTLHQNHPNPFNPSTTITFSTADAGFVTLLVYNLLGQRVRTLVSGTVPAGDHAAVWDGRDDTGTPSGAGVYLYRLTGGGRAEVKKMLLLDGDAAGGGSMSTPILAAPKPAASTWTVTITGDEIEPREMNGLEIADGGSYDFYVIFMGELMNFHLVQISGGTFAMSDSSLVYKIAALPFNVVHQVTLSNFEMSAYETTNTQYAMFLNEAFAAGEIEMINGDPYGTGGEWDGKRYIDLYLGLVESISDTLRAPLYAPQECFIMFENGSFKVEESGRRHWPVVAVTWYGAKAFAQHYDLDLPTEAEWEYAAGGGVLEYVYATDDGTIDHSKANYLLQGVIGSPIEVGSYPPNPFGLYDMSGNVWEWCNDWYGLYSPNPPLNPKGPLTGDNQGNRRILRGGYYGTVAERLTSWYRDSRRPEGIYNDNDSVDQHFGFRVVRRP